MSHFQRRHYLAIAEIVQSIRESSQPSLFPELEAMVEALSHLFAHDNPRFSGDAFRAACGLIETE